MKDYKDNYRVLDCWECFEARGKMCHDKDYGSMMKVTGSSNKGHGICCKSDFTGKHCNGDSLHTCSEPVHDTGPDSLYKDILSTDNLNYQMFAFCTQTNQKNCGMSSSASSDMSLLAGQTEKVVSTTEMRYKHGRPSDRQYDSCYYELGAEELTEDQVKAVSEGKLGVGIQLTVTKASKMNVFLYGGNSRFNATESVVPGNGQVELNKPYFVDY